MKQDTSRHPVSIPARTAAAFSVRRGETIRIVNVEGGQIGDFICFNLFNFKEKLSTGETVNFNTIVGDKGSIYLTVGKRIYSNAQNPMFEITEDMSKGVTICSMRPAVARCMPCMVAILCIPIVVTV